jgi:hypothetical protein
MAAKKNYSGKHYDRKGRFRSPHKFHKSLRLIHFFRPTIPLFWPWNIPDENNAETSISTVHINDTNGTERALAARWPIGSGVFASTGTAISETNTDDHMKKLAVRTRKNSYGGGDSLIPKTLPSQHMSECQPKPKNAPQYINADINM